MHAVRFMCKNLDMGIMGKIAIYAKSRARWDDICMQCGLCCHERVVYDDGEMDIDLSSPCEFLAEDGHTCTVYKHRFESCPDCSKVTFRKAISDKYLPSCCAYRRLFE